jgi:energy-coupling factor transporter ATP-binding protein EcfA2
MKLEETPLSLLTERFVNSTNQCIFLTGKAGTGKTTFLKKLIKTTHKKVMLAAPTGIAAINAGGVTLHSLFQLPFGSFVPVDINFDYIPSDVSFSTPKSFLKSFHMHNSKRALIREMELLIIDEVSMLRADMLDAIDLVLRTVRKNKNQVFGGVQILFIGDLFQLPPVIKRPEKELLARFYKTGFFFEAIAIQQVKLVHIEFDKVFRQSDQYFIDILNHFRENKVSSLDIQALNKYYKPELFENDTKGVIQLTTHNYKADKINAQELQKLKAKLFHFEAQVKRDFFENAYPVDKVLSLKKGAQVMFIKNDPSGKQQFFNGKIGHVASLSDNEIEVEFDDSAESVYVERYTWENKRYSINNQTGEIEEEIIGTFAHFPLKLAWAITVHKSQGLTFQKAIIDINDSFAQGQVYVALSRLTSLNGLILKSPVSFSNLSIEPEILSFSESKQDSTELEMAYQEANKVYAFDFVESTFSFQALVDEWQAHINSYDKDETKSKKQSFKKWASAFKSNLIQQLEVADKFKLQIKKIRVSPADVRMEMLNLRTKSAIDYFKPIFANFSGLILDQINRVKSETGTKAYIKELKTIDLVFNMQLQKFEKALAIIESVMQNKSLDKILQVPMIGIEGDAITETKKWDGQDKKEKIPTKVLTYNMFREGLSPSEIASNRVLALSTINKHLREYIAQGEISAKELVSKEKIDKILALREQLNTLSAKPIIENLEPNYCSYDEILFVLAEYRFLNSLNQQ